MGTLLYWNVQCLSLFSHRCPLHARLQPDRLSDLCLPGGEVGLEVRPSHPDQSTPHRTVFITHDFCVCISLPNHMFQHWPHNQHNSQSGMACITSVRSGWTPAVPLGVEPCCYASRLKPCGWPGWILSETSITTISTCTNHMISANTKLATSLKQLCNRSLWVLYTVPVKSYALTHSRFFFLF